MVLTSAAGFSAFGIAAEVAILRGAGLPNWLGWVAILIGIVVLTPAEFVAVLALAVWMIVVSILIATRGSANVATT